MKENKKDLDNKLADDTNEVDSKLNYLAKQSLHPSMIHLSERLSESDTNDVIKKAAICYTLMELLNFYNLDTKNLGMYNERVSDAIRGMVTGDYSLAYNSLYSLNIDLENQIQGGKNERR